MQIESTIAGATVFSEAAHVTRRARVSLEPGRRRIALAGLPANIDPATIRVSTSRGVLRSIETEPAGADHRDGETSTHEKAIDLLESRARVLRGELDGLKAELALIDALAPQVSSPQPTLRPDVFLRGLDFVASRRKETLAAIRRTERELEGVNADLNQAQRRRELAGLSSGGKSALLVVTVDAAEAGEHALEVVYEAAWATWRPYYHLRLDGRANTVECTRYADVWQETGEDWDEVALRLSTAEPEPGLRLPAVVPWTLGMARGFEDRASALYADRRAAGPETKQKPASALRAPAGAPHRTFIADKTDAHDDGAGAATADLVMDLQRSGMVGEPEVREQARAPADEMDDYAQQFQEEGVFASITSTGMTAAGGVRGSAGGLFKDLPPEPEPEIVAPSVKQEQAFGAGKRRVRKGPSAQHPDHGRLSGSALPRDASGGIDFELEVAGRSTHESGLGRRRISLGSTTFPAKVEYLLRPAVRDYAFGRVTVVNEEKVPFLAGPVAIFVGEGFFGETRIETTPAGGKLVLDLGAETAIRAARRSRTSVRTSGIITKEDVHEVDVAIDVENHLAEPADVEVQDQIPLSKDDEVKVELMSLAPKEAKLDPLTGLITFKARVAPRAKLELRFVYEIEVPKDYQLQQRLA